MELLAYCIKGKQYFVTKPSSTALPAEAGMCRNVFVTESVSQKVNSLLTITRTLQDMCTPWGGTLGSVSHNVSRNSATKLRDKLFERLPSSRLSMTSGKYTKTN